MARRRSPRVNRGNRRRNAASAKRRRDERAGIDRRGSYLASRNRPDIRTGSNNRFVAPKPDAFSGREQGIAAANTGSKEDKLQQSVGSLDRRIATALEKKDTDLAKDLRSRQNKFVKELALERVRKTPGGTIQGNVRMRDGTRPMTTAGFNVFQDTIDRDFLDPTRRLQNIYPEQAREMYPVESRLQMGLPTVQAIKALFDIKDKPIPYTDPRMPGERYALDFTPEGEVFAAPTEDVFMEDLTDDQSVPLPGTLEEQLVLPKMAPFIDKETRNEVFAQDVDNLPANNYNKLLEEFQNDAEGTPTGGEQQLIDALAADGATNVQDELTSAALQAPGYNLNPGIIEQLFEQGFLTPGTNYFGSTDAGTPVTNPLVDEALASYYDSLK